MTHSAVLLILDALACFRLTRLVVADTITASLRQRLIGHTYEGQPRYGDGTRIPVAGRPKLAEFLGCPWCVGFWCALAIVLLQAAAAGVCVYVTAVLGFSAVAGLLMERG